MLDEVECVYREAYVEGVTALLTASGQLEAQSSWLNALRLWMTLPQINPDDCPFPPNADGTPSGGGTGWPKHTPQRARCRGFSQGVHAALSTVQPSLREPLGTQMQKWRDVVLKWRNKNERRARAFLPSPPVAPHFVNS